MLIDISQSPTRRELRWFAGVWWPAICGVLGWFARDASPAATVGLWTAGIVLGAAGLLRPRIIQPVYKALIVATFPLGWLLSHVVLRVMYFGVITPIAVLVRTFHDPMERAFDPDARTYWVPRAESPSSRYFRQF